MIKAQRLNKHDRFNCCYCSRIIWGNRVTQDHLVPLSERGNNHPQNLRPCCWTCNHWKGNKSVHGFLSEIGIMIANGEEKPPYYNTDKLKEMEERLKSIQRYVIEAGESLYKVG